MSLLLLDTSIASDLLPLRASPLTLLYAADLRGHDYAISFQTHAEMWQGAESALWGPTLRRTLARTLARWLWIPPDTTTSQTWAQLRAHAARIGRRLEVGDAWIAATAVQHGLPLLTHDRDFVGLDFPGLEVVCHAGT